MNEFIKHIKKIVELEIEKNPKVLLLCKFFISYFFNLKFGLFEFSVLWPKLSSWLLKKNLIEIFNTSSLNYLSVIIENILERRKNKLEIKSYKYRVL